MVKLSLYIAGIMLASLTAGRRWPKIALTPPSGASQRHTAKNALTTPAKIVLLDYFFNNERRRDPSGNLTRYHYTWEDRANTGFSTFGELFRLHGAVTDSLAVAPTAVNLRRAAVYIIVDQDDEREVPHPNYPGPAEIRAIGSWVNAGGVLLLMGNDSANAGLTHFNLLSKTFGIQFNDDDYHKVTGDRFEMGAFNLGRKGPIFSRTGKVFIKELSTLTLSAPAEAYFSDSGHVIMATAKIGRGTVFAVGDPWFYNEYIDGNRLPPEYENRQAADDLVRWLLRQASDRIK